MICLLAPLAPEFSSDQNAPLRKEHSALPTLYYGT